MHDATATATSHNETSRLGQDCARGGSRSSMSMRLVLDRTIARQLVEHSRECFPNEACGLLFGRADTEAVHVHRAEPAENIHAQPDRAFQLDWRSLLDGLCRNSAEHALVGFYHSHPRGGACPSTDDAEHVWPDQVMVICAGMANGDSALTAWRMAPGPRPTGTRRARWEPLRIEFALQPAR